MKQLGGYQFYRQRIIGDYIVDFYCPKFKLVIEVDGGQHYSDDAVEKDTKRDAYLASHEIRVLRFTNADVLENIDGVIYKILEVFDNSDRKIPLSPPLAKGGD